MHARRTSRGWLRRALGTAVGFLVLFVFGDSASGAEDEAAWLFDSTAIVEIDLDLPPASIAALEVEPDEYQPATFALETTSTAYGPYEVGARLKGGAGSFRPLSRKAAFKVKFDEYVDDQTFFGLEKLTLNNMVQDPTMVHETLAYDLFRSLDVAAPRTGYALVRVNGVDYGVYLNVETLDAVSLPRWFDSTRHLYEGGYGVDVVPGQVAAFEVDEGKSKDRADLEALIVAVNDVDGDWSEGIAPAADLIQMTRMWAVERYVGHWDGYSGEVGAERPNNYYLHSDEAGLFQMLPWGTDATWEPRIGFGEAGGGVMFNRCLADASCEALYRAALAEVRSAVAELDLASRAEALDERLAPCRALETMRREHTVAEVGSSFRRTLRFIAGRPAELATYLGLQSEPLADPPFDPPGASAGGDGGEWPCPELMSAQPESKLGSSDQIGHTGLPAGRFSLNRPRLRGDFVVTQMRVPGAGLASQQVSARLGGRRRSVCEGSARSDAAGSLAVRCRLSGAARQRLEAASLGIAVRVQFAAAGETFGPRIFVQRLPRQP